jgi:hypothetical protein
MPWASTRIVPPTVELVAVFTTAPEEDAACVAAEPPSAAEVPVLLLELLPHAASRADAARAGITKVLNCRICALLSEASTVIAAVTE